ncbi:MAG: beta strand repeat-containing protein [Phycisphaerales bacterium JB064]
MDTITVTITGQNDAATPTNATTVLVEDTTAPVMLAGVDPDLGDAVESVRVDSLPDDGTLFLNGIAVNAGDVISSADVASGALTYEPPADWSGTTEFQFSVSDGETWSTTTGTQFITVTGQADAPVLTADPASGTEDTAIALSVSVQLSDTDGSEEITKLRVTGAPAGSIFTDGVHTVTAWDGSADVTALDLSSLSMIPAANHDQDFTLTFSATSTETDSGSQAVGATTLSVHVDPVNDAPLPQDSTMTTAEDTSAIVNLHALELDTGDTIESYRIESLPTSGQLLLDGAAVQAGQEITAQDVLTGKLTFEPDDNWNGSVSFEFSASDGEVWSADTGTFTINVTGVADAPIVTVPDIYMDEDGTAQLDISAVLADTDGSESISAIKLSGAPVGTVFSDGVHSAMSVGSPIDVTSWDLDSLTIAPAENYDRDFNLTVRVTAREADSGHQATTTTVATVHVTAINDAPLVEAGSITIAEDVPTSITLKAIDVDQGDAIEHFRIDSLPEHGTLTINGAAVTTGQVIDANDVSSGKLVFTPDGDWSGQTSFTFSASDGQAWSESMGQFQIGVQAVADAPIVTALDATGSEDSAIALDVSAALADTDGSETMSLTISGVPTGATLNHGTDLGGGNWSLSPADLDGLAVTPAQDSDQDFTLTITARSTEANGSTATTTDTLHVSVSGVADAPSLSVSDAAGIEDTAIPLDLSATLTDTDGSESLSITISGVPAGAQLSSGTHQGGGVWTLDPAELPGLTITPAQDSDADFTLTVTATSSEANGSTSSITSTVSVSVDAAADAPLLSVANAQGFEDSPIVLDISSALTDTDGSETLAIRISGVPQGATLSAGTSEGNGVWRLSPDQLSGLALTPPADFSGEFDLTITAQATEATGDSNVQIQSMRVSVDAVADAPDLALSNASGFEDLPIALDISSALTDIDGSESLSLVISGVPDGATLSAGSDLGDGSWSLSPQQLQGLTITPPADSDGDFTLSVTATSHEGNGSTAEITRTIDVHVQAVADEASLIVTDVTGLEDTPIALNIQASLADTDGSEDLTIRIAGVPSGASLSAGVDEGNGVWRLEPDQLDGLTFTPPHDTDGQFDLSITATTREANGSISHTTQSVRVSVDAVADDPTLSVSDTSGAEDTTIPLDISAVMSDLDGSESLTLKIAGVPDGATLSAGNNLGNGVWELTPGQLDDLTITPAEDFDESFTLTVTATSTDAGGSHASTTQQLHVSIDPVAETPVLQVMPAAGVEDQPIPLHITAASADPDGSETISVVIQGVPDGATLSAGEAQGDGSWQLTQDDLAGLTISLPADSSDDFTLTITTTAEETNGSVRDTTATLDVSVAGVADAPDLSASGVQGFVGAPMDLDIAAGLADTDGSETLTITISGVPDGVTLSAGAPTGDGVWTLSPEDLDGLTLTGDTSAEGQFTLVVTAVSTEADGDSVQVSHTIQVRIDAIPTDAEDTEDESTPNTPVAAPPQVAVADPFAAPSEAFDWTDEAVDGLEDLAEQVDAITMEASTAGTPPPMAQLQTLELDAVQDDDTLHAPIAAPTKPLFTLTEPGHGAHRDAPEPGQSLRHEPNAIEEAPAIAKTAGEAPSTNTTMFGLLWAMVRSIGPGKQDKDRDN